MKKLVFLTILFLGITTVSFSQSKSLEEKAAVLTEKLNAEIIAGDKALALSDEQKAAITKIHTERLVSVGNLSKDASAEEKTALNKTHYNKIFGEILTKEQREARKKGKLSNE